MPHVDQAKVLIFIVAYNAERTIQTVLRRIPSELSQHDTRVLIIDDSSSDSTFERAREIEEAPFPITVLFNPGEPGLRRESEDRFPLRHPRKVRFRRAGAWRRSVRPRTSSRFAPAFACGRSRCGVRIAHDGSGRRASRRDAALQVDGQQDSDAHPESSAQDQLFGVSLRLPDLFRERAGAAFRSTRTPTIFTSIRKSLFSSCAPVFASRKLPIPTYYGDEICRVNGMKYALDVVRITAAFQGAGSRHPV